MCWATELLSNEPQVTVTSVDKQGKYHRMTGNTKLFDNFSNSLYDKQLTNDLVLGKDIGASLRDELSDRKVASTESSTQMKKFLQSTYRYLHREKEFPMLYDRRFPSFD